MADAEDMKGRERSAGILWHKRMTETNPEHARYYCEHGVYVGHNRLFLNKCGICYSKD